MPSAPKQLGKYEILEVVGRGGMGVVYKAVDPEIGRLVGIKMMTSAVINDPVLLKRFYREAQSAGKLRHPNIVTIYDLGIQEAMPYLVMEFLEGESLDVALRSGRTLLLEEKLSIVVQVCNALAYAHEQSIVHRDIKPGNVMLLKDGTVKLVDFGIARIGAEYVTRTGQLMGSIQYMSPEQVHGMHVDLRADIFSTGVLLYQLLTNVLPFEGVDAGATLLKIVHDPPPPLGKFLPEYPPELDSILQRVLAKVPGERYQTATELAFDLSHVEERLKRKRISGSLQIVEQSIAEGQWDKSREQLLQLLKIDRQNTRANELLRQVQQQIQRQERAQRIRDLQTQAEQAIAKNELDEALRYLNVSISLDEGNSQLRELRDTIQERKQRADRVADLLARAKSSLDTEDLENALASAKQALKVDADNPEAKQLHAAISNELTERTKLKQVHSHLEEARKQISSRHFTAALDLLRKAEGIDPNAPGVNELVALASAGQQQERRRKELEQFSSEIGEALNRNDYNIACAKAAEALEKFPNDRGLLKLQALAEKERENCERRVYVEAQVSLARRLLEEKKSADALVPLQEALARYPDEFVLQSMYSLFTEYLERDRSEQFKTKVTQQAKDAMRRREYKEAIEILEAAKQQTTSADFDDLLHFCQEEAANYVIRQRIDATAKDAHRLTADGEYGQAIELLESTLKEIDDQELHILLDDARRHVQEFNSDLQDAMATARRLLDVQRYIEAVKFVDTHAARFGKTAEFSQLSAQIHHEQQRVLAFSAAKEQAREGLANGDYASARAALDKYRKEFDADVDTQLLQREIEAKESESAATKVAQALNDCHVLLQVGCYKAVLDILKLVSSAVDLVPAEMKQRYDFARASAIAGISRERSGLERLERIKRQLAPKANEPTLTEEEWQTAGSPSLTDDPFEETQLASVAELESVLGQVTLVAKHYAQDEKILSAVGNVRQRLTIQIAAIRHGDTSHKLTEPMSPKPGPEQSDIKGRDLIEQKPQIRIGKEVKPKEDKPSVRQPADDSAATIVGRGVPLSQPSNASRSGDSPTVVETRIVSLGEKTRPEIAASSEATIVNGSALSSPPSDSSRSKDRPAPVETRTISFGDKTVVSEPERPGGVRPRQHAFPAPTRLWREGNTTEAASKWLKTIPAAVVAAILLVLIVYMVWRVTHRNSPGTAELEINTIPQGRHCVSKAPVPGVAALLHDQAISGKR